MRFSFTVRNLTMAFGNFVVMRGGRVMLGLAGRALVSLDALDDEAFSAAVGALIELRA